MRRALYSLCVVIHAGVAIAEEFTEYEKAGAQLALAAVCRASYGEHELFDIAFVRFERVAVTSGQELSTEEIAELRQTFYETEAIEGENPFTRGFCNELKSLLMPQQ